MRRSTDKILTTHTGSLPRPAKVVELLLAEKDKPGANRAALDAAVEEAVAGVVKKQIEAGLDVINDGEQGRTDYTVHVLDRLTGFEGKSTPPLGTGEPEFPGARRDPQPVRDAVPASSGLLRPGGVEGLAGGRGRHRAGESGDGEVRRGGILHDLAVAGADRALSEEPLLQDRRGIPVRAGRCDGQGIPRHRRCRFHPSARLSRPRDVLCALSRHQHSGLPQDHREERRGAQSSR